ncbi:chromatin structure-remodeling complex protein syd [Anaeramoeba flamelloides]|uniref:Chromatin structure-remodeling complex protein syd n=1 Tax=Anaeramoeba flamelloides TaxID=1746091 RepID=A0AAV7YWA3_9EUKA|nr:chromatin structure-remodeling complex protein syd [Anaeramoeba flamelloides]
MAMFIKPSSSSKTKKKKFKYNPKKHGITAGIKKIKFDRSMQESTSALMWMQEVLQFPDLKEEDAFNPNGLHLLNMVNVISPRRKNKLVTASLPFVQQQENLKEFIRTLEFWKYPTVKLFTVSDLIRSDQNAKEQLIQSILYLKAEYEKTGVRKDETKDYRKFYIMRQDEEDSSEDSSDDEKEQKDEINEYLTGNTDRNTYKNIFFFEQAQREKAIEKNVKKIEGSNVEDKGSKESEESEKSSSSSESEKEETPKKVEDKKEVKKEVKKETPKKEVKKKDKKVVKKVEKKEVKKDVKKTEKVEKKEKSDKSSEESEKLSTSSESEKEETPKKVEDMKDKKGKKDKKVKKDVKKDRKDEKSEESEIEIGNDEFVSSDDVKKKKDKKKKTHKSKKSKKKKTESSEETSEESSESEETSEESSESEESSSEEDKKRKHKSKRGSKGRSKHKSPKKKKKRRSSDESSSSLSEESMGSLDTSDEEDRKKKKKHKKSKKEEPSSDDDDNNGKQEKLQEGENEWAPMDIWNEKNKYYRLTFTDLYQETKKKTKSWVYEVFEMTRAIYEISGGTGTVPTGRTKKIQKPYKKEVGEAFNDARKYLKLGDAIFQIQITQYQMGVPRDATLILSKKSIHIEIANIGKVLNKKWSKDIEFLIHKLNGNDFHIGIPKENITFKCRAKSKHLRKTIVLTCLLFTKFKNNKKMMGYNPFTDQIDLNNLDLSMIPTSFSPNKKFDEKISSIIEVKQKKKKPSSVLEEYYSNGGVNFLCTLLIKRDFPLSPGYIKIRKNIVKIGQRNKTVHTINFKDNFKIFKHPTIDQLFMIGWDSNNTDEPAVYILAASRGDRSLITSALYRFHSEFLSNQD